MLVVVAFKEGVQAAGVAKRALGRGTSLMEAALKLIEVRWREVGWDLLRLIVIVIIYGWNAGSVAEAGKVVIEVQHAGTIPAVNVLPALKRTAELGASRVEVGSGVACVGVE